MATRRKTRTSTFGTSRRESHDSTPYYQRNIASPWYRPAPEEAAVYTTSSPIIDKVLCHTAERMEELPDNCVALMVTSPPYHVGKDYDSGGTFEDYVKLLRTVFAETYRVLIPGGRAVVNVANLGRRPYVPLAAHVTQIMEELGFLMRGEVIWVKGEGASGSCAWGSWRSAANPTLRDVHEYCLCFSKGRFERLKRGESTISREEFTAATLSVWEIPPERARRVGHPAPFPVELPRRFIELYTFRGDLVLDPFMGSGSTAIAAIRTGRHYVGYEIDQAYVDACDARVGEETEGLLLREASTEQVTEVGTAIGLRHSSLETALDLDPTKVGIEDLDAGTWDRVRNVLRTGKRLGLLKMAFANGRFLKEHVLRGKEVEAVRWRGATRLTSPVDIWVDESFLISCKYRSKVLHNASPYTLFKSLLGVVEQAPVRTANWYAAVAPKEYQKYYEAFARATGFDLPAKPEDLDLHQRVLLAQSQVAGKVASAAVKFSDAVSTASSSVWKQTLAGINSPQPFILRMLRVTTEPYYILGVSVSGKPIRVKVMSASEWLALYPAARLIVSPRLGSRQPVVEWEAEIEDRHGRVHRALGHVEIRWSHGKFRGAPEAKVYLDTPLSKVPGHTVLVGEQGELGIT